MIWLSPFFSFIFKAEDYRVVLTLFNLVLFKVAGASEPITVARYPDSTFQDDQKAEFGQLGWRKVVQSRVRDSNNSVLGR